VIVETLTDNRNAARHVFTKNDGNLGGSGAVACLFERRGIVLVDADGVDEDHLMLAAAEGGADDVELDGSTYQMTCAPESLASVREAVEAPDSPVESAELTMAAKTTVGVSDENDAETILPLIYSSKRTTTSKMSTRASTSPSACSGMSPPTDPEHGASWLRTGWCRHSQGAVA
jgi:transcriptional/translational regulatory protein YebC/TACO1